MRITTHIPDELNAKLRRTAQREKTSVSAIVAEAVERYIVARERGRMAEEVLAVADGRGVAPDALEALRKERRRGARA